MGYSVEFGPKFQPLQQAHASQIVSHILRMWRLKSRNSKSAKQDITVLQVTEKELNKLTQNEPTKRLFVSRFIVISQTAVFTEFEQPSCDEICHYHINQ